MAHWGLMHQIKKKVYMRCITITDSEYARSLTAGTVTFDSVCTAQAVWAAWKFTDKAYRV